MLLKFDQSATFSKLAIGSPPLVYVIRSAVAVRVRRYVTFTYEVVSHFPYMSEVEVAVMNGY